MLRIVTIIVMLTLLVFGRGPLAPAVAGQTDVTMMMVFTHGPAGEHSCPLSERGSAHGCCTGITGAATFSDARVAVRLFGEPAIFFSRGEASLPTAMAERDPPVPKLVA